MLKNKPIARDFGGVSIETHKGSPLGVGKINYPHKRNNIVTSYLLKNLLDGDIKVLYHLVYEYDKGVRPFVLYTMDKHYLPLAKKKLEAYSIDYFILDVEKSNSINIFFGEKNCVTLMREMLQRKSIDQLSPEEDFILGAILGYDIPKQCARYCQRKKISLQENAVSSPGVDKEAI